MNIKRKNRGFPRQNFTETKANKKKNLGGFTLVEMVIYVAFVAILSVLAITATLTVMKAFSSLRLTRDINQSATVALERMSREIRNAYDVDTAQSTLGTSPGRLMLNTKDSLGANTTVEFYVDGSNQLGVKEGGIDKGTLMAKNVTLTNMVFNQIATGNSKAIKINMTIRDAYGILAQATKFYNTIVLRGSVH